MPIREAGRVHARARKNTKPPSVHPIEAARTKAKLSRSDLAKISGVNEATIWRIEKGESTPHQSTLGMLQSAIAASRKRSR